MKQNEGVGSSTKKTRLLSRSVAGAEDVQLDVAVIVARLIEVLGTGIFAPLLSANEMPSSLFLVGTKERRRPAADLAEPAPPELEP
ncbi:unnamed protein product [Anisakis simplex]|uniref:Uncharacterized protein n=1 Tax=Anisakis simplex TaxID=6269 RepID=A0A0M3J029_ANISI|nr:unnamed protein product [Anisakis simplex]